jgi:integrase
MSGAVAVIVRARSEAGNSATLPTSSNVAARSEPRLIVFAALSGLRLGEVLALRDTDVNLEDGFVLVRRAARKGVEGRTKTRKRRRVYLCARARS